MDLERESLGSVLAAVAAKSPAPGGGAVASITAALGASLAQMVLRYSLGKKSLAQHAADHEATLQQLEAIAAKAMDLARVDAEAYAQLNALWKLDKADPQRISAWAGAVQGAIAAPRQVLELCLSLLETLDQATGTTNAMLDSDLAIAAVLADAAARASAWNVRINLPLLDDAAEKAALQQTLDEAASRSSKLCQRIEHACTAR